MIKLNNKNITYVALANTNNSLKAPKEIWYADSSNSVKLVYRRKDALIEGEDYEKYHWLDGRNGAYIDTNYYPIVGTDVFSVHFHYDGTMRNPDGTEQNVFGVNDGVVRISTYINSNNYLSCNYLNVVGISNVPTTGVHNTEWMVSDLMIDGDNFKFTANDTVYEFSNRGASAYTFGKPLYLFNCNQAAIPNFYLHGDISSFKITDTSFNVKMHFIPCKLLKPVPKWLDANGIRRQVGECGMIDLISGKFYGNVNSVGTFTVENYYERKEWLVGDGSAYIDTLHLANEGLDWETHVSNLSFKKYFVWNRVIITGECPAIALYHSVATNGTVRVQNNYTNSIVLQNQTNYDYIVATNSNGAVINEVQYIGQSASENISNKSIKLFYCDINESAIEDTIIPYGGNSQDVKCAYFRFLDSNRNYIQNLIPCTLTMDLPASMDANNIARTKGTSGMWDLVSDRFYGNVANSGTFKAVNLAKGVDYEVHQWLVADIPDNTRCIDLPINSEEASYTIVVSKVGNTTLFETIGNKRYYVYATSSTLKIWDITTSKSHSDSDKINLGIQDGVILNIDSDISSFKINNIDCPKIDFPISTVVFRSGGLQSNSITQTSSILVDGIERYIPVKLLKSIPSKYDANGIARQAGECGMYDTINDVFYGNVASSGSFTVSDDN